MTVSKIRLPDNTEHDIRAKYLIQSTSSDAVSAEFSARSVTDDAIANIQKIYGNTITWNQLSDAQTTSATFDGTQIARGGIMCSGSSVQIYSGHKYLIYYHVTTTVTGQIQWKARILNSGIDDSYTASGSFNRKMIFTATAAVKTSLNLFNNTAFTPSSGDTMSIRFDCLFDLTAIYGSGNEPTVSEFEEQFPTDYYPYSPLTLLSNSATAIQSKDSGNNVIGNCDLNIPTLTGKLNGTSSSVVIFPNGMQSNGTTRDELTATSAIKRIADDNSVLSTPQTFILDNALQLQYPVVAGGTEMVLPTTDPAPMKMDVIYGNAADAAATMSQNFISVDSMKEFLAALGTQMNGTWAMQYSGGKYTFTFTSN